MLSFLKEKNIIVTNYQSIDELCIKSFFIVKNIHFHYLKAQY